MHVARNLRLSLLALSAHRVRSVLAVAGAAIGVAGVLVLSAIGTAARKRVLDQIESLGRNMLVVSPRLPDERARLVRGGTTVSESLTPDDAAALLRGSANVVRVAPAVDRPLVAKFGPIQNRANVVGTTPDWLRIRRFQLAEGRFFTDAENWSRERVAVLGWIARTSLFADGTNPLGRTIRIGTVPFEVVGVLTRKGVSASGTATEDDRILIPLETAMYRLLGIDYLDKVYVEAASADVMMNAERDVAASLRVRHAASLTGPDDFVIENQRVLLNAQLATQASFQRLLIGLALLSLFIAGLGILSILLLSVRERRREIGLRVAVGARRSDLLAQFFVEALVLAGIGGAIGILLGTAVATVVSATTSWQAEVSTHTLAIAFGSALLIGVCSGVQPALRAAALEPIDALNAE